MKVLSPEIVSLYRILWRDCKAVGPLAPVSISIQFLFPVSSTIVSLHGGSHIDKKKKECCYSNLLKVLKFACRSKATVT